MIASRPGYAWLLAVLLAAHANAADPLLFTSFRSNGETGVFFALSEDGLKWTPVNNNQAVVKPEQPGELMRDPFLARGPGGVWHMIWTWGWTRKEADGHLQFGYSSSRELVNWTPHRAIRVFREGARGTHRHGAVAVIRPGEAERLRALSR